MRGLVAGRLEQLGDGLLAAVDGVASVMTPLMWVVRSR